jgi:hypothetical protein
MRNLSTISADAEQLSAMVHGALLAPFWAAAAASDTGVWFDAAPWLAQPLLFWKEGLKHICHGLGAGLVKEKAVIEVLQRLQRCALCVHALCICAAADSGARILRQAARVQRVAAAEAREPRVHLRHAPGARNSRMRHLRSRSLSNALLSTQAIFAAEVFPRVPHFAPGAPLRLGADASFGPWTVRCDVVDAADTSGACRLAAPPLSMWDVLSGDFSYCVPLPASDGAGDADAPADADALGLRIAAAPHMPPVHGMDHDLRAVLPLAVCGCDGDAVEGGGGGDDDATSSGEVADDEHAGAQTDRASGAGAPETFSVRRWSAAALAAPRCVRVRITFTRPRRAARDAAADAPAEIGSGQ